MTTLWTDQLRGVIFDMDGVLCDSEALTAAAACRMFAEHHGVQVTPEDFHPFIGTGEDSYLGGVAAKYGVTLRQPQDKAYMYALYLQMIPGRLTPLPGVRAFIGYCRERGLKLAVASSADRVKVDGNLAALGLPPERFDALVTGSDVARKKPDPEAFLLAALRLELPPAQCLVVEDAPSGVRAAKAAGCRCLGLTWSVAAETLQAAGADFTAANLAAVLGA